MRVARMRVTLVREIEVDLDNDSINDYLPKEDRDAGLPLGAQIEWSAAEAFEEDPGQWEDDYDLLSGPHKTREFKFLGWR